MSVTPMKKMHWLVLFLLAISSHNAIADEGSKSLLPIPVAAAEEIVVRNTSSEIKKPIKKPEPPKTADKEPELEV